MTDPITPALSLSTSRAVSAPFTSTRLLVSRPLPSTCPFISNRATPFDRTSLVCSILTDSPFRFSPHRIDKPTHVMPRLLDRSCLVASHPIDWSCLLAPFRLRSTCRIPTYPFQSTCLAYPPRFLPTPPTYVCSHRLTPIDLSYPYVPFRSDKPVQTFPYRQAVTFHLVPVQQAESTSTRFGSHRRSTPLPIYPYRLALSVSSHLRPTSLPGSTRTVSTIHSQ